MKSLNDIFSDVDNVLHSAKHGNFEEVLTKTKNYAEQATKKSSERLEISKKKIELLDSKTKLNKAYEAFGKLQYEVHTGEAVDDEALQKGVQEIQLLKSRVDLLEVEVKDLHDSFIESLRHDKKTADDVEVEVVESE